MADQSDDTQFLQDLDSGAYDGVYTTSGNGSSSGSSSNNGTDYLADVTDNLGGIFTGLGNLVNGKSVTKTTLTKTATTPKKGANTLLYVVLGIAGVIAAFYIINKAKK